MLKEYSYGAVIYKVEKGEPLFLLVKSQRSGRWGFPKGHIEEDESASDAAKREIFEETGIEDISFIDGFMEEDIYIIDGTQPQTKGKMAEKHSVYFLAETAGGTVSCDNEEISELRWVKYEGALPLLFFPNQRKILEQAYNKIKRPG